VYLSGLGLSDGGFDFSKHARAVAADALAGKKLAKDTEGVVVLVAPDGSHKSFVRPFSDGWAIYDSAEPKVGQGSLKYLALVSYDGIVTAEKMGKQPVTTAGQYPIDPYANSKAADLRYTTTKAKGSSMMPWLLAGSVVLAAGVFYIRRKP